MKETVYYLVSKQKPVEEKYFVEKYDIAVTDGEHQPLFCAQWIDGLYFNNLNTLLDIYNSGDYFIVDNFETCFYWSEFLAEIEKSRNLEGFQCDGEIFFRDSEGYLFTKGEAA